MQSHIIPEFLYKSLYDHKHRFRELSRAEPRSARYGQKGLREPLLCKACESKFSVHERYVSRLFSGRIPVRSSVDGSLIQVQGIDYKHFRLFGLSILWRAGISAHPMFKRVQLGTHSESLRRLLLHDTPGHPHQYGFLLSPLLRAGKEVNDLIVAPTAARLDGIRCYRFVFGGLLWAFTVSKHRSNTRLRTAFINHSGQMLMVSSELADTDFLTAGLRDMLFPSNN